MLQQRKMPVWESRALCRVITGFPIVRHVIWALLKCDRALKGFCTFLLLLDICNSFNIFRYGCRRIFISQGRSEYKSLWESLQHMMWGKWSQWEFFLLTLWMLDSGPGREDCPESLGQTQAWLHRINSPGIQCCYRRWNSLTWPETSSLRLSLENNDTGDQWPYIQEHGKELSAPNT